MTEQSTLARLERAIVCTAHLMREFKMPELLPTLKRLEAERTRLVEEGGALEYADKILAQSSKLIEAADYLPEQNRAH